MWNDKFWIWNCFIFIARCDGNFAKYIEAFGLSKEPFEINFQDFAQDCIFEYRNLFSLGEKENLEDVE